jgi:hypothetical protein
MTEQATQAAQDPQAKKPATEVTIVTMEDGRTVAFGGKRSMLKDIITQPDGGIAIRFDFRNGQTLTAPIPTQHLLYAAGFGYAQKLANEVAGLKNDDGTQASDEDKFLAIEALHQRLTDSSDWNRASESSGEGVSGASIVLKALMEVSGKSLAEVKAHIEQKLKDAESRGQKLTRAMLYASLRNPTTRTGQIVERLEREKAAKAPAVNVDEMLEGLM